MVKARLCDLVTVLDRFAKFRFELLSFDRPLFFEGTVKEFCESRQYQIFQTDYICGIEITGNYLKGCTIVVKIAPSID